MPIVSDKIKSKVKRRREKKIAYKSRLPLTLVTAAIWGILISVVLFLDPSRSWALEIFLISLYLCLLLTISLFTKKVWQGLLWASATTLFLVLRYVGIGNLFNFFLIIGVVLVVEFRLLKRP